MLSKRLSNLAESMASVHGAVDYGQRIWPSALKSEEKAIFFAILKGYTLQQAEAEIQKIDKFLDRAGIQRSSWPGRIRCQYIINHLMKKSLFIVLTNFWKGQGILSNSNYLTCPLL